MSYYFCPPNYNTLVSVMSVPCVTNISKRHSRSTSSACKLSEYCFYTQLARTPGISSLLLTAFCTCVTHFVVSQETWIYFGKAVSTLSLVSEHNQNVLDWQQAQAEQVAWKRFTSKTGREDMSGEHNGTRVKCMRVDKLPSQPQGRTLFYRSQRSLTS